MHYLSFSCISFHDFLGSACYLIILESNHILLLQNLDEKPLWIERKDSGAIDSRSLDIDIDNTGQVRKKITNNNAYPY
jgi:hypothetical protein